MASQRPQQDGYHLQHIIESVAPNVDQYDASHGIFGELITPDIVLKGLQTSDHVGKMDDPTSAEATQAVHSFVCQDPNIVGNDIKIEVDNQTQYMVVLRWLDEKGICYPHFQWLLEPFTSKVQYTRYGHLFIMSIIRGGGEEQLLGAYRIRMSKPSGSGHYIRISEEEQQQQQQQSDQITAGGGGEGFTTSFHIENLLSMDDDNYYLDEMIVACASLDTMTTTATTNKIKTIKTLSTIISNLQKNPMEPKFRSLRLTNPTVQKTIGNCWGAKEMLHSVGFRYDDTKEHLVLLEEEGEATTNTTTNQQQQQQQQQQQERLQQAKRLLERLQQRSAPGFVPELELGNPPPWIGPVLVSTTTNARAFGSGNGTHFLSDDEKWERAERNRHRRGRAGRRPDPGNAPSSNGRWGR